MKFKVGDKVIKARRYSNGEYCKYGGDEKEVPIGTEGEVTEIEGVNKLSVEFPQWNWSVDVMEVEFVKGYKPRVPKTPTHLVVWEEDEDPFKFFDSLKEANDFVKELSENTSVKQDSIILVEIKSARKVTIQKRLTTKEFKI